MDNAADIHPLRSSRRGSGGNPVRPLERREAVLMLVQSEYSIDLDDGYMDKIYEHEQIVARQERIVQALEAAGWQQLGSLEVVDHDDEAQTHDTIRYWHKSFDDDEQARADANSCGAVGGYNFSIGWDCSAERDSHGRPDCLWWDAA